MPTSLYPVGLEQTASTPRPGGAVLSSLAPRALTAMPAPDSSSGCVTNLVCYFTCSSHKPLQQMSDRLCKLGLDFTCGNGDGPTHILGMKP